MIFKPRFMKILRSKATKQKPKPKPTIVNVYKWASYLTAEDRVLIEAYYWTQSAKTLLFKLKNVEQALIGVIGLQGTGKTTTLEMLASEVYSKQTKTAFINWTPDWFEQFKERAGVYRNYKGSIYDEAWFKAEAYAQAHKPILGKTVSHDLLSDLEDHTMPLAKAKLILGTRKCKELLQQSVYWALSEMRYIFIDLPDYSKKSRGNMIRDLRDVETLWKKLQQIPYSGSGLFHVFLIGCQKELFGGHFFFGKMDVVEIKPLKPNELVQAYKQKWKSVEPFTEEALLLIAELSRGVFRRFLKYIVLSIETAVNIRPEEKEKPLDRKLVEEAVSMEQIMQDMDLELSEVFKDKTKKVQAVKLLTMLRQVKEANQKEIATELDINEMNAGRLVKKLEAHGYVKRRRGERGAWLTSLK